MQLESPESAIASAVIFNALIIVALIPLALRGVRFRAASAAAVLRRNLLVYGLGGLIVPFVGIKLIDLVVGGLGIADEAAARPRARRVPRVHRPDRARLPARRHRRRAGRVPGPRGRLARRAGRQRRRLAADRPDRSPAARYFHPRPSAAGDGYDAMASSASNLGPTNEELLAAVRERSPRTGARTTSPPARDVPVDAVTASGSGPRPAHLARERAPAGAARRARTRARASTTCSRSSTSTPTAARSASSASRASTCSSSTSRSTARAASGTL